MSAPGDTSRRIELLVRRDGDRTFLCAPAVGTLAVGVARGAVLAPGAAAGWLTTLGRARRLDVPAGVEGRVVAVPPHEHARAVAFGEVLFELAALAPGAAAAAVHEAEAVGDVLAVRAPHAGRFWSRPSPDAPVYAAPGAELAPGSAIGLIEVMKTFNQVAYRAVSGLPPRARVVRALVADGAEVEDGTPLVEVEPA